MLRLFCSFHKISLIFLGHRYIYREKYCYYFYWKVFLKIFLSHFITIKTSWNLSINLYRMIVRNTHQAAKIFIRQRKPELTHKDKSSQCFDWITKNISSFYIIDNMINKELTRQIQENYDLCWFAQCLNKMEQLKKYFDKLTQGIAKRSAKSRKWKRIIGKSRPV